MTKFRLISALSLVLSVSVTANTFVEFGGEAQTAVPESWFVSSEGDEYPYQIVNDDLSAELLIFKSTIDESETITNEEELKLSVEKVINEVILTLPQAQLLTNTGVLERKRVWFALDFTSFDEERGIELIHRLKGVMYRHPDGHQILFSLWGKAAVNAPPQVMDQIRLMQEEFSYSGDSESEFFAQENSSEWLAIGVMMVMLVVMIMILRRRRAQKINFSDEANFWRCECGRLNHNDHQTCRRCGQPNTTGALT
ncbi:MAG: hypothetical protein AB1483_05105 [Candidatus Zixiibacteriota bacterium]